MIIISAMTKDRVIGSGEGMPWDIPEEFNQFLAFIKGQTLIMGRRSYDIFHVGLTSKYNIVVSRSVKELPDAIVCPGIESAVQKANSLGKTIYSAGGATIYAQTIPLAGRMYLSYIKGEYAGDAYFPEFDESEWEVEKREDHDRFEFVKYRRKG